MVEVFQLARALGRQRRAALLAAALFAASLLIGMGLGSWQSGAFAAVGVLLGLANAVLTEMSLARFVAGADLPSRKRFAISALVRLGVISLIAFALVALFWPAGGFVFLGLALFQLLSVALTGVPLLKELRKA